MIGLRVGILVPNLHWHGGSQVALSLADAMHQAGEHVELAVIASVKEALVGRPTPTVPTTYLEASMAGLGLPKVVRVTRAWIRNQEFDVVLAIGDWASMVAGIACLGLKRRPPVIVGSEHFPVSAKFGDFSHLQGRILGVVMRFGYRNLDASICVNQDLQARMVSEMGWEAARCPVIHNPVRLVPVDPVVAAKEAKDRRARGDEFVVVTACALQPRKDLPTLLKAFAEASKQLPMQLKIAGTGGELETLQRLSQSLGIESKVEFLGAVKDMSSLLRSADVFGFSSTMEALPQVIPEAISQALPVVATDCRSGPSEIIIDEAHGRLVPVGDDRAMAAALVDVLQEQPDSVKLVNRARDFAPDRIAKIFTNFFRHLMASRRED